MSHLLVQKPMGRLEQLEQLFANKSPILVEVQFPGMATSSDWYLCQDLEEFETIADRLTPGVKLRLASVYDVSSRSPLEWTR